MQNTGGSWNNWTKKNTLAVSRWQGYSLLRNNKADNYLIDLQSVWNNALYILQCYRSCRNTDFMRTYTGISCNNRLQTMDFTPWGSLKTKIQHNVILQYQHKDVGKCGSSWRRFSQTATKKIQNPVIKTLQNNFVFWNFAIYPIMATPLKWVVCFSKTFS